MKKLVFLFVAFAAVSFASCGNKTANNTEVANDSTVVAENTPVEEADTTVTVANNDSTVVAETAK